MNACLLRFYEIRAAAATLFKVLYASSPSLSLIPLAFFTPANPKRTTMAGAMMSLTLATALSTPLPMYLRGVSNGASGG